MDMLSVENVRKSFGGLPVLKGISLEVRQGEVLAVIGPSGSGKAPCCAVLLSSSALIPVKLQFAERRWSQIMSRKRQFMRISKPV